MSKLAALSANTKLRRMLSWFPIFLSISVIFLFMRYAYEQKIEKDIIEHRAEAYHKLLYQGSNALIILNQKGLIVEWNSGAERIFGWKSSEVIGSKPSFMMLPNWADKHELAILRREALNTDKGVAIVKCWGVTKTGSVVYIHIYACSTHAIGGYYHIAIINLVSDIKLLEVEPRPEVEKVDPPPKPEIIDPRAT